MPTETELEKQDFTRILTALESGSAQEAIVMDLLARGWERSHARRYVSGVAAARALGTLGGGSATPTPALPSEDDGSLLPAYRDLTRGAALLALGVGLTVFTYRMSHAPGGDGRLYLFYGAVVIGALRVVRGVFRLFV